MASILGKTPFVDKILGSCSAEQLSTLASLINNPGSATTVYLYGNDRTLSNTNKGVSYVQLMIDEYSRRYLNGFLVYIDDTHCGFFSFSGNSSHLVEISIDPSTLAYVDIYENLSAEEFRRTLGDMVTKGEGGNDSNIYEVSNINNISKDILDELKAGDVVVKITGKQKHTYTVSYKGEGAGEGICLTYVAAGYMETVSYDRSGSNWVYNSTDVVEVGAGGGGTKLYLHTIDFSDYTPGASINIVSTYKDKYVDSISPGHEVASSLPNALYSASGVIISFFAKGISGNGAKDFLPMTEMGEIMRWLGSGFQQIPANVPIGAEVVTEL